MGGGQVADIETDGHRYFYTELAQLVDSVTMFTRGLLTYKMRYTFLSMQKELFYGHKFVP